MFSLVLAITLFFIALITFYRYGKSEVEGARLLQLMWGLSTSIALTFIAKVIYEIYLT